MGGPCLGGGTDDQAEPERVAGFGGHVGQAIMSASADGIIAIDEHGYVRVCNPAAAELFGRPAGELIGSMFGYPITVGKATEIELVLPESGGRLVEMRVTSTTLEGERVLVAALRDVTWRRRQEKELEAALDREQSVVAVAAHELRNPLAAIAASAHVLRDLRTALTNEQRVMIADHIVERTVYLQTLTRKLLTVSRIDGQPERSNPRRVRVLDLILERLTEVDATSGDVNVSCSADLEALVDPGELSEMLVNCLENAFAHGRPPFEVGAAERKGWVEVRVCDSGPGVPKEFVPYLFERFSRAPGGRGAEGSGLGLWIVRSLAQANGGDVRYEPGKRGGACFVLRLRPAPPRL